MDFVLYDLIFRPLEIIIETVFDLANRVVPNLGYSIIDANIVVNS